MLQGQNLQFLWNAADWGIWEPGVLLPQLLPLALLRERRQVLVDLEQLLLLVPDLAQLVGAAELHPAEGVGALHAHVPVRGDHLALRGWTREVCSAWLRSPLVRGHYGSAAGVSPWDLDTGAACRVTTRGSSPRFFASLWHGALTVALIRAKP